MAHQIKVKVKVYIGCLQIFQVSARPDDILLKILIRKKKSFILKMR